RSRRNARTNTCKSAMKQSNNYKRHSDLIWNIANLRRGPYRPPQYRRVMIPLTVLRRLDCVLEETKDEVIACNKKLKANKKNYDRETIEAIINKKFDVTFHNTSKFTFTKLLGDPNQIARNLNNFINDEIYLAPPRPRLARISSRICWKCCHWSVVSTCCRR